MHFSCWERKAVLTDLRAFQWREHNSQHQGIWEWGHFLGGLACFQCLIKTINLFQDRGINWNLCVELLFGNLQSEEWQQCGGGGECSDGEKGGGRGKPNFQSFNEESRSLKCSVQFRETLATSNDQIHEQLKNSPVEFTLKETLAQFWWLKIDWKGFEANYVDWLGDEKSWSDFCSAMIWMEKITDRQQIVLVLFPDSNKPSALSSTFWLMKSIGFWVQCDVIHQTLSARVSSAVDDFCTDRERKTLTSWFSVSAP